MGLALGMALEFYASVANELKIKARNVCKQNPRFVEVTEEKLLGEAFWNRHHE